MLLKICLDINSHNYEKFTLYKTDILEIFHFEKDEYLKNNFLPEKFKLFNQDIFDYEEKSKSITIYSSSTRNSDQLPGILKLDKTYGKYKKKLLYKCIPDDKRLPEFLIPYNVKFGFSKKEKCVEFLRR